jgi:Reverse transcriptase (RNA-dependent DNA polymerase)
MNPHLKEPLEHSTPSLSLPLKSLGRLASCCQLNWPSRTSSHAQHRHTRPLLTTRNLHHNYTSETFRPDLGTPQGSPMSPIISALFTSPLLREAMGWEEADLSLYVDDRAIFALGPTFHSAVAKAAQAGLVVFSWLRRFRLSADAKKTEVMFFTPPHTPLSLYRARPTHMTFMNGPDPIRVKFTNSLHYLGVFIMPRLSWTLHITTMAIWVQSTVKALGILGNSAWGFSLVQWQKLFQALLVPVLTYSAQVWFTDWHQSGLIKILQTAQNKACQKLVGVFKTTPVNFIHTLLCIPPIEYRLHHLLRSAGSCLSQLPPSHALCTPEASRRVTGIPRHTDTLPIIPPHFIPQSKYPYLPLPHPGALPWTHAHFCLHKKPPHKKDPHTAAKTALRTTNHLTIKLFILTKPSSCPDYLLGLFGIFIDNSLHILDFISYPMASGALLLSLLHGLR